MKRSKTGYLEIFILLLTTVLCCTPMLESNPLLKIVLILFSIPIFLKDISIIKKKELSLVFFVFLYLFLVFLYRIAGFSSAAWGRYVFYLYIELQVLLMLVIPNKILNGGKTWVLWFILIVIGINVGWNIYMIYLNPQISINWHNIDEGMLHTMNIGLSSFHVMCLFFFNVCFFVYLNCKIKAVKYINLFFSMIAAVYIVGFCYKASVVIFFFLSLVLLLLTKNTKSNGRTLMTIGIAAVVSMLLLSTFTDSIVKFIVEYSPSERLTQRLVLLIDDNSDYANDSSYNARVDLWYSSLFTWFESVESFFIGVGDHWGDLNSGVGQHSDLLDHFAKYGLMGTSLLIAILVKSFKAIISFFDEKYHVQIMMIILVYLACGVTKRIFFSDIGMVFYLLLPLAAMFVNDKNVSQKKVKINSNK